MKVGIFDSGVGGISVLKPLLHAPFEEIIYYADTANLPYGTKDKDLIISYSLQALDFFAPYEIDLLIVACNTASAYALPSLRAKASYPVLGVIEAGVLALRNALPNTQASILILATQATTLSQAYPQALKSLGYKHIRSIATSLFVPLVEEGILEGEILQACFRHYFSSLPSSPDALILGCTHYPFIQKALLEYFGPSTLLIHSGEAILEELKNKFSLPPSSPTPPRLHFHASYNSQALQAQAMHLLSL